MCSKLKLDHVNHIVYTLTPERKQWKMTSWVMKIDNANNSRDKTGRLSMICYKRRALN